jgi:hypothetical protein
LRIDVASNVIQTPQDVADTIRAALDTVPPERLYPGANCGVAPMSSEIAHAKLAALAAGAELARKAVSAPHSLALEPVACAFGSCAFNCAAIATFWPAARSASRRPPVPPAAQSR